MNDAPNNHFDHAAITKGNVMIKLYNHGYCWQLFLLAFLFSCSCAQVQMDVIHLKSGGKAVGRIIAKVEGKSVQVKLQSDEILSIDWDNIHDIDKITIDTVAHPIVYYPHRDSISYRTLYLEAGGLGLLYSINYEGSIQNNITIRIGIGSYQFNGYPFGPASFTGIPLIVNYLIGDGSDKIELGIGAEYVNLQNIHNPFGDYAGIVGAASIGYRNQPKGRGFNFRFVLTPFFTLKTASANIGISAGVNF